jgi:hypothetical protein
MAYCYHGKVVRRISFSKCKLKKFPHKYGILLPWKEGKQN